MDRDFSAAELAAIEARTQVLGREIFEHLAVDRPAFWQRRWWDDRIMSWSMQDERLKVQLFRFVDVLPMLKTDAEVVGHLHEYLALAADKVPWFLSMALDLARWSRVFAWIVAGIARASAQDFARRFIAGTNVAEVLAAARRERDQRRAFTLDILGEAVISEREVEHYFRAYAELIEGVAPTVNGWPEVPLLDRGPSGEAADAPLPRCNVSVKLSALDSQFDPIDAAGTADRVGGRLRELLRVARRQRAFVNVDMESYDKKDLTLAIFQQVLAEPEFRETTDVGIVVQCYLRDTERDLAELRDWAARRGAPVWVRLVKGAYWDYETVLAQQQGWPIPVFQEKWQSDATFERLTRFALANLRHLRPALGSHNVRSLAHGMAVAEHLGLPKSALELQMLYGMADPVKQAVVDRGWRMRVYMPYGELIPGMAYLVRRLLENTSNDSFLRASLEEQIAPEVLLRSPGLVPGLRPGTHGPEALPPVDPGGRAADNGVPGQRPGTSMHEDEEDEAMQLSPVIDFENEPPVDFALAENRRAMQTALDAVRKQLGRHYPLVINGEPVDTEARLTSSDPSQTSRIVGTSSSAARPQVLAAVEAAKKALPAWGALDVGERADYLTRAAAAMRERKFELAAWIVYECGKPWRDATGDVAEAIDFCEYYAECALALQGGELDVPGEENQFDYLPRGVAAVIAPWNFPLAILTGMTVAALVTGNPTIMKPAEQSPVIAGLLMEIFAELDLPPGVLQYLPGTGEQTGAELVAHPEVAIIAFTGSKKVGLSINATAAEVSLRGAPQVKRVIAEMGGKNAIIVDADADLDEAVVGVMKSAFGYQGQKCSACSRAIVLDSVHDAFVERLVEASRSLKVGPAEDPATSVGPLIDEESAERVRKYVEIGLREGRAVLAVDVSKLAAEGHFVGPHIFADIKPTAHLAHEEIFGPVLAIIRVADFDEALRVANGTEYALTGGLFSRSPVHLERARREFMVGNLYLNRGITGALVARQPFGGFKHSGIGTKAGGPDYLLQFVVPRTITENTLRRGFAPASETGGE